MDDLNTTVYVCQTGQILMKNKQGSWGLQVRFTGLSGRGATLEVRALLPLSPEADAMTAVGVMSEANRASLIAAAELGRVDVYRDQFEANPAFDAVRELHKQRIIEKIFD